MQLPPKIPRVPLENYLLNLRPDIKIVGASSFLEEWHRKNFASYGKAASMLGFSESFYRRFIQGKLPIPIWAVAKFSEFDTSFADSLYSSQIKFTARREIDVLPKTMSPSLAYFIGFLHGDGHLDKNQKRVTFTEYYESQLRIMKELTKELFDVDGYISFRQNGEHGSFYGLDIGRVTVSSFLSDVIGIVRGKRTKNTIPDIIKNNRDILRWYICGLFDAEGSMPRNPKSGQLYIDFAMADSALVHEIGSILKKTFGLVLYGPYKRKVQNWRTGVRFDQTGLRIHRHAEIKKFLNIIGSLHPDKVRRKAEILNRLRPQLSLD